MNQRDIYNNVKLVSVITPQAVGTTGIAGGKLSSAIDLKGYGSAMFSYQSGTSASVADTITPLVYEADATGDTFTSVAAADLLGTEAAITLSASAAKKVGYKGNKRYLKLRLYGTGTATAIVAATAVLGTPEAAPVA
jgi:hypothetical protein